MISIFLLDHYKQFVLYLKTDEFLKDPNSVKCCSYRYNNLFTNNHYGLIMTEDHSVVNNKRLYPKTQSIENQNKFALGTLVKKYNLVLFNSLREY